MWCDQRLISNDSESQREEKTTHPSFAESSELTRVLRCVGATETLAGQVRGKEVVGRRGMRRPLPVSRLPPPETPPGAGRLPEVGSGNFLQESQKSRWNILERLSGLSRNCSEFRHSDIVQIIQILPEIHIRYCLENPDTVWIIQMMA